MRVRPPAPVAVGVRCRWGAGRVGVVRRRGRLDERGGAVSLWVVLMVPVAIFAAVAAMAAPLRLRAETSVDEAAADLAKLAAAWRHGEEAPRGLLEGFPPECASGDPYVSGRCEALFEPLARDLGSLGVDLRSLRGYYSDALTAAPASGALPCGIGDPAGYRAVVLDATHVAIVADWRDAGWAAAQVWPRGLQMGGESVGRLTVAVDPGSSPAVPPCDLDVSDRYGRPLRVVDPHGPSQELLGSVPSRSPFGG